MLIGTLAHFYHSGLLPHTTVMHRLFDYMHSYLKNNTIINIKKGLDYSSPCVVSYLTIYC